MTPSTPVAILAQSPPELSTALPMSSIMSSILSIIASELFEHAGANASAQQISTLRMVMMGGASHDRRVARNRNRTKTTSAMADVPTTDPRRNRAGDRSPHPTAQRSDRGNPAPPRDVWS